MAGASSEPAGNAAAPRGDVLVTGAAGFIGRVLVAHFDATGRRHRALVRRRSGPASPNVIAVADLAAVAESELAALIAGAEAVVHLAGRAHVPERGATDAAAEYARANVVATAVLARAAVRAGVSRFVLASSVKVNGETSAPARPFGPDDVPAPADAYAASKLEAERQLATIAAGTPMAPIVLRLPLVYGPGVKGHFATLLDAIAERRSLPFGAIDNRRSLVYVGNLADAIDAALDAEPAPAGVHFVADARSVSVPELARAIGAALDVPARLRRVPPWLLMLGGRLSGRGSLVQRVVGSLEVDPASFVRATGWRPACTLAQGLEATARWWRLRHAI